MRRTIAVIFAAILIGGLAVIPSALALSESKAESSVRQRADARYPGRGATVSCNRLSTKRFSCRYQYLTFANILCAGGASVQQLQFGVTVNLGRPHALLGEPNSACL